MLNTSIDAAWHALSSKLDAAAAATQADRAHSTTVAADHLQDVGRAHEDYLAAVQRACWLPKDANSQVWFQQLRVPLDCQPERLKEGRNLKRGRAANFRKSRGFDHMQTHKVVLVVPEH